MRVGIDQQHNMTGWGSDVTDDLGSRSTDQALVWRIKIWDLGEIYATKKDGKEGNKGNRSHNAY